VRHSGGKVGNNQEVLTRGLNLKLQFCLPGREFFCLVENDDEHLCRLVTAQAPIMSGTRSPSPGAPSFEPA